MVDDERPYMDHAAYKQYERMAHEMRRPMFAASGLGELRMRYA